MLTLALSIAVPADEYEEQILFRGIEWGSNYNEAITDLGGISMCDLRESEYWYSIKDYMNTESGMSKYNGTLGGYTYASASSLKDLSVAGYPIESLYMYFIYTPGEEGMLIKDTEHTKLVYAYYKIKPKDLEAAYDDLTTKLTSLYGDVDETDHSTFLIDDNQNLWYGANGTMVSVVSRDYNTTSTKELYIKYGFAGGDDLMKASYDALVLEESKKAANNTDGL